MDRVEILGVSFDNVTMAKALANQGWNIVAVARRQNLLDEVCADIEKTYGEYVIPAGETKTVTVYFFVPQGAKKADIETYNMENEDLAEDYRTLIGTVDL